MQDISLDAIKRPLISFLKRFHLIIFVILVFGGLSVCVFVLYSIFQSSGDTTGYQSSASTSSFDDQTIEKLNQLKDASSGNITDPPDTGRTNPFVE